MAYRKFPSKSNPIEMHYIRIRKDNAQFQLSKEVVDTMNLFVGNMVSVHLDDETNTWYLKKDNEDGYRLRIPSNNGLQLIFSSKEAAHLIYERMKWTGSSVKCQISKDATVDGFFQIYTNIAVQSGGQEA